MLKKITLLLVLTVSLISCTTEKIQEPLNVENTTTGDNSRLIIEAGGETFCTQVDLIAGQNYDAGNVSISLEGNNLLVTYETEGDWIINVTHLYVGDCAERPANNPGNPLIGHFPYSETHQGGTTSYTYTIDISNMPNCICIAAHAEVSGPTGNETAWADGEPYGGNSWAMYFSYCLDQCIPH